MKFARTPHAPPGPSRWVVRAGLSKAERARDPGPRMIYTREEEREAWFLAKAFDKKKEERTMQIVRQVLEDKSNLMKKHKQEVLGRLQDTNEAIEVVAKTIKGVRERVLHEVMEDLIDSCSEEEECSVQLRGEVVILKMYYLPLTRER